MASWFSNLIFGKDRGPSATDQAFSDATARRGRTASDVEQRYLDSDAAFDPGAALDQYSQGAISNFRTQLGDELTKLSGSSVGAGRFDSGLFDADRGKVVTDLGSRLQSDLNSRALDVAGMRQRQIESRGQYAAGATQDYNDMLAGQLDRETAKDNAKRQQRGAVIGGALKLAGSFIPGA